MPIEDLTISEAAFKRLTATLLRRLQIWLERHKKKQLKRPLSLVSFVVSQTNETQRIRDENDLNNGNIRISVSLPRRPLA
jgi:hypothetical protein